MNRPSSIGLEEVAAVHSGSSTLYHSLGHIIRSKIQSGEWAVGQQIPSEREMMKIFNLSRATVRQGIEHLVKEGVLKRIQGKGTFVSPSKIEHGMLRFLEISDVLAQSGLKTTLQLIGKEKIVPPANVCKFLALSPSEPVFWFQGLLIVNQEPILIESSYFPAKDFPGLLEAYTGAEEPYQFVVRQYGVRVARAREIFEPVLLEEKEAALLGTQGGVPALWVEEIAYNPAGEPVAYVTSLMRGDHCRFYTELILDQE